MIVFLGQLRAYSLNLDKFELKPYVAIQQSVCLDNMLRFQTLGYFTWKIVIVQLITQAPCDDGQNREYKELGTCRWHVMGMWYFLNQTGSSLKMSYMLCIITQEIYSRQLLCEMFSTDFLLLILKHRRKPHQLHLMSVTQNFSFYSLTTQITLPQVLGIYLLNEDTVLTLQLN